MSGTKETARGSKRKSSDSPGSSDNKKGKVNHNGPTDSTEKLFDNDQCIRSILAYLSLEDLANVAQATHFLKMNALVVFETVHASSIQVEYDTDHFVRKQMVFRQFGSLAKKVTVSSILVDEEDDLFDKDGPGRVVLATIGRFCGNNLKDLTLRRMLIDISPKSTGFTAKNQTEVRKVLGTLSKLSLVNVCMKSRFFEYLRSLEELTIHSCCPAEEIPQVTTLSQLKVLHIGACPTWPVASSRDYFNRFLRANPSIEEFDYHFYFMGKGHLKSICSLPRLTNLKLYMIEGGKKEIALLSKMDKLKKLKIYVNPRQRVQFSKLRQMISTDVEIEDLFH